MKPATKKWLIAGGIAATIAAGFFIFNKLKLGPIDKFVRDSQTPGTPLYMYLDSWNKANRPGQTYEAVLPGHIEWHTNPANNSSLLAHYNKASYSPDEVVPL